MAEFSFNSGSNVRKDSWYFGAADRYLSFNVPISFKVKGIDQATIELMGPFSTKISIRNKLHRVIIND